MLTLWHRTTHEVADAILAGGFVDTEGDYGLRDDSGQPFILRGVWLADVPLGVDEFSGPLQDDVLLRVLLSSPADVLADYEIVEPDTPRRYREWCIPAEVLNRTARVAVALDSEVSRPRARVLPMIPRLDRPQGR